MRTILYYHFIAFAISGSFFKVLRVCSRCTYFFWFIIYITYPISLLLRLAKNCSWSSAEVIKVCGLACLKYKYSWTFMNETTKTYYYLKKGFGERIIWNHKRQNEEAIKRGEIYSSHKPLLLRSRHWTSQVTLRLT